MSSLSPNSKSSTRQIQSQLRARLKECMGSDFYRLSRQLNNLSKLSDDKVEDAVLGVQESIERSVLKRTTRASNIPDIKYPELPVSEQKEAIKEAIAENQVVIIAGETGSGKTTQIPKICLELGRGIGGLIGHTQPRRLAARTVSTRIAEELETPLGEKVGFKIRFSDSVSDNTYIKLMTDGILLAEIQQDRYLNQYDTLIIDEAHERSLNIDFILGYLKQLLPKRPDLKVVITSATIDPERFSKHFFDAPIIQVSGRTYPVEMRYRPLDDEKGSDRDQTQGIIDAVDELMGEGKGDILVFLSGEREIRDTAEALNRQQYRFTDVLPLYARLSTSEQNRIFQSHSNRRIVLATNVAETSLTVPGIKYVIDPGFARISRYSYRSKVQRLPIEPISQASANQRAGRCGRVSEGVCIRLYGEDDYLSRPEFTDPEILRTNLGSVILQMLSLGLGKIDQFPFVQAPDSRNINDGFRLLEELCAIDETGGRTQLTKMGRQIARLTVDPRYARMVIEAARLDCLQEVIIIAAGLSIQDPRERPQDKKQAADEAHSDYRDKDSDFVGYVNVWNKFKQQQGELSGNQLRKWCKKHFLNYLRMREWQDIVSQLKKSIAELGFRLNSSEADYQRVHTALASGLLSHLGFKDKEREYLGARNARFMIFPGSGLAKKSPKWCMGAELVETSRLFARTVARIDPEWIEPLAAHLVKYQYSEPYWSKKRGSVMASQKVLLYGQTLVPQRRVNFSQIDPQVSQAIFIREALVNGDTKLSFDFLQHNQSLVNDVLALEDKSRRRDILVDEDDLVAFYQQHLPDQICSEASFSKWWRKQSDKNLLRFEPEQLRKENAAAFDPNGFPDQWLQGNLTLPLTYHFEPKDEDDGISLIIPLPLLNQVKDVGFDWLVSGLRHELLVTLIKSLPKRLRRNFVPAPDYATAVLSDIQHTDKQGLPVALLDALSLKLHRMTGVKIESEDWQIAELPAHLKFNFKVVDESGKLLGQGRSLERLRQVLQGKVKQTLEKVATPALERDGLTAWDFAPLEKEFINKTGGFEVKAYPALQADKQSVSIKLFDHPAKADYAHKDGVAKLVQLNIPSPIKYLQEKLPNKAKLGLYFNPFGEIRALIDDCILAAIDGMISEYCQQHGCDIRDEQHFSQVTEDIRGRINETVLAIAEKIEAGLTTAHGVQKKLKGNTPLNLIQAYADIKQHLASLVYPGFVRDIGMHRLDDWNRYINALAKRAEKVAIDPNKDRLHQLEIDKVQSNYDKYLARQDKGLPLLDELAEVRWMIEELRVSFFAQQLGTRIPISSKRINNYLSSVQSSVS